MIHYYVIDLETTGLRSGYHEVTQVSIIRGSDRHQLNKYIKAEHVNRASPKALEVTGRTYADLSNGEDKEPVVKFCNKFLDEDGTDPEHLCMIGHNAHRFDKKFAHALWESVGMEFPAHLWLDTLPSTKAFAVKNGIYSASFNLENCMRIVGVKPRAGMHNAVSDTQNTYILWQKLEKGGVDMLPYTKRLPHKTG